jgi:hypothetical protein
LLPSADRFTLVVHLRKPHQRHRVEVEGYGHELAAFALLALDDQAPNLRWPCQHALDQRVGFCGRMLFDKRTKAKESDNISANILSRQFGTRPQLAG